MTRTARTLSDLWRISSLVYREAILQSLYVLKRGGQLAQAQPPAQLRQIIVTNTWLTKGLLCLFLAGISAGAALAPTKASFPGVPPAVGMAVVAGMFIFAVLLMIAVMALDMVTGFVAAKAVQVLALLPLTRRELATTSLLGFVRIFDAPLLTGLATFGLSHLILTRSLTGALAYVVGVATAEAFAVVLALALAELFYTKVINQRGSGIKSIARLLYLLFSLMPGFGMFLVFSYQAQLGRAIMGALAARPELAGVFQVLYPMSFGFLVAAATGVPGVTGKMFVISGAASAVYAGLAVLGMAWAASRLRSRALGGNVGLAGQRTGAKDFKVKPVAPWLGVLVKDMRIAFRSPSEAALLLMPAAAVIPWAITMGAQGKLAMTATGLVTFVAFMSLTAVATLFSVDVVGGSFIRTLPVRLKWVLAAKAAVAAMAYTGSMLVVLAITALAGRGETGLLAAQAAAGLLPMAAGALVTGLVLSRRTRRGGGRTSPFLTPGGYLAALGAGTLVIIGPLLAAAGASAAFGVDRLALHFLFGLAEFGIVAAGVFSRR
ncbi:MAG: hypothetical protein GX493_12890 [Firmicutes bacterium]|nr:hypothetical protein [Bacillota bacterium]